MLLVHCFVGFFCFLNLFFKAFLLNWSKNLRAQFGLSQKMVGVQTPWTLPPPFPLDARLKEHLGLVLGYTIGNNVVE